MQIGISCLARESLGDSSLLSQTAKWEHKVPKQVANWVSRSSSRPIGCLNGHEETFVVHQARAWVAKMEIDRGCGRPKQLQIAPGVG